MELFNITFDLGGIISLVATFLIAIIIVWKFKIHKDLFATLERLKKTYPFRIFPVLFLLLIAFISLWLTVRVIGIYVIKRYVLEVNYMYQQEDIFLMLAHLLTANLCFTLLRALAPKGKTQEEYVATKGLIDVAIQAVIIGFITFIPRYTVFLKDISGSTRYILGVLSMMISIAVLVFARQRVRQSS